MSKPIEAILVGAGDRGHAVFGKWALEHVDDLRFVAVAEPNLARLARFAKAHSIPPERQYTSWEPMLAEGQIADAMVCTTLDDQHVGPTLAALGAGYDVLLEKPMATTLADCVTLVQAAERAGRLLQIAHVLRYTSFFSKVYEMVASGRLGDVITTTHHENVAYWHMAHSFVRGNWRSTAEQSPMILAKCCHDLDLLVWLIGRRVTHVQSFGSLTYYRPENAPHPDVPARCTDGCPAEEACPFYAPRLYLGDYVGWPVSVISEDTSLEARRRALETGPYGRCVYRCDNDVVDHQTVSLQFEGGATAVLVMHGHSDEEGRATRIDGTRGSLRGRFSTLGSKLTVGDHLTDRKERVKLAVDGFGHGGGDEGLAEAFVRTMRDPAQGALTTARESLESHLLAFAAEESRLTGQVVDMDDFRRRAEAKGRS
jgi:predicted dehydrogenase